MRKLVLRLCLLIRGLIELALLTALLAIYDLLLLEQLVGHRLEVAHVAVVLLAYLGWLALAVVGLDLLDEKWLQRLLRGRDEDSVT